MASKVWMLELLLVAFAGLCLLAAFKIQDGQPHYRVLLVALSAIQLGAVLLTVYVSHRYLSSDAAEYPRRSVGVGSVLIGLSLFAAMVAESFAPLWVLLVLSTSIALLFFSIVSAAVDWFEARK
jgi:hypothetical protein